MKKPAALGLALLCGCASARPAPKTQAPQGARPAQASSAKPSVPPWQKDAPILVQVAALSDMIRNDKSLANRGEGEALRRLQALAQDLDLKERPQRESCLYRGEGEGALWAEKAVSAYAEGQDLRAIVFAQAALGEDFGNEARRALLRSLAQRTGIDPDPEGILPSGALIEHELRLAEAAFFERRFGAAVLSCRRALILDPDNAKALVRLGSAHYALGESAQAHAAYERALQLDPADQSLRDFIKEKGWSEQ